MDQRLSIDIRWILRSFRYARARIDFSCQVRGIADAMEKTVVRQVIRFNDSVT